MKLSASRITVIFRCPREYVYKYIMEIPEPWNKNFAMGKAFHEMLELKEPNLTELNAYDPDYPWTDALHVMRKGYDAAYPEHVNEVKREIHFENELRHGYIDSVLAEDDGSWVIGENKTRSSAMNDDEARMLPANLQVQIYVSAVPEIAEQLWLDPDLFKGVKYVTSIKPNERRKKTETKEEFGARLSSQTQVIEIPKAMLTGNPEPMLIQAMARAQDAETAFSSGNPMDVPCNTAQCFRYNSPCPYFNRCHGGKIHEQNGRRILGV